MADEQPAASSAAVESEPVPFTHDTLNSFTHEQRKHWWNTGELPDTTPVDKPAASTPAQPADQAASTDAKEEKADSEPAAPEKKPAKPVRNAETRVSELLTERSQTRVELEALRREVAELRGVTQARDGKPAAASAAPVEDPEPDPADLTKYPAGEYDRQFITDQARWASRQEWRAQQAAARRQMAIQHAQHVAQTREAAFFERIAAAEKADPEFSFIATELRPSSLAPEVRNLKTMAKAQAANEPLGPLNALADEFLNSAQGPQLMRHFSDNLDELRRFAALRTPEAFRREIIKLELALEAAAKPPIPKLITTAPEPPATLGRKPAAPDEPYEAAVASGDVRRYMRLADARDIAARKR